MSKRTRVTTGSKPDRISQKMRRKSVAAPRDVRLNLQLFQTLLNSVDAAVAVATPQGRVVYTNSGFLDLLGIAVTVPEGFELKRHFTVASWQALETALRNAMQGPAEGELSVSQSVDQSGDCASRIVRVSLAPVFVEDQALISIVATEVTQLLEARKAVVESEASIRSLTARLLRVQDEERRRLARDLHDTTGQEIAFIVLSLERLLKSQNHMPPETRNSLSESITWIRKVENEIRTLSYLLHPPLLDEMGLASALNWFIEGFSKRTGIEVELEIQEGIPRMSDVHEMALFRVVQESLTNVFRHSGSSVARVRLTKSADAIFLAVEDEGKGFAVGANGAANAGVGIQGMRGRLQPLGGSLELITSPNGSSIIASLPWRAADGAGPMRMPEEPAETPEMQPAALHHRQVSSPNRVLIADDHEITRQGIRALLAPRADLEICGEAASGADAIEKIIDLRPDLAILDVSMPRGGGTSVATYIRAHNLPVKVIFYTTYAAQRLEYAARAIGCDGFVTKSNASDDLLRAVTAVLEGGKFFDGAVQRAQSA